MMSPHRRRPENSLAVLVEKKFWILPGRSPVSFKRSHNFRPESLRLAIRFAVTKFPNHFYGRLYDQTFCDRTPIANSSIPEDMIVIMITANDRFEFECCNMGNQCEVCYSPIVRGLLSKDQNRSPLENVCRSFAYDRMFAMEFYSFWHALCQQASTHKPSTFYTFRN